MMSHQKYCNILIKEEKNEEVKTMNVLYALDTGLQMALINLNKDCSSSTHAN